ncbi:hypothetical protein ABIF99_003731 [Bradyrhizobium japonicum]|nr:hypothetical protein [Bradyrhizobium japonicum]MCP1862218.1 hypothetical protein [Bradyrhizobium japonicum]MCP1893074.1 hypothetical protein [Bradyrhizobium japonicum]MCW2326185.1 hypothetical protein [Bradyrhizobium japonicum]
MTSISAASAGNYQSPLQRLQQQLQSDVSDGTIASSDQSALSTALTDIDTALQSSRSSDQSSGTRPSKDEMKSKIDDLIANEVSNGTLTSDQADELKNVFQSAFAKGPGGAGGPGGPGGPGGAGGPPPGPPPDDSSSDSSSTDSTSDVDQHDHGGHSPAIPPGAPAVAIIERVLWRQRQLIRRFGFLRTSDRLQELT